MMKRKTVFFVATLLVLIAAGGWLYAHRSAKTSSNVKKTQTTQNSQTETKNNTEIKLYATGDWIAHDSVNAAAKQANGTYDYTKLISNLHGFASADIRFCNDPILNGGTAFGITGYPKFNSPTDFVTSMHAFGCNLVNTASNHSFDFSQANITASVDAWAKQSDMLAVAGENRSQEEHDTVRYFTVKGVKFAFLAYTSYINTDSPAQNNYGVNVFSQEFARKQISEAKAAGAQFIIASMRWGTEYATALNSEQQSIAQFLADQGVQLVLGHGTHTLQPVQELTGASGSKTMVWYGLGNFLNTQLPPETLFNGIPVITIDTKTLQIKNQSFVPIYMSYRWTAAQAAAENTNARTNVHLYPLENATQTMLSDQQLKTTIAAQKQRMSDTLGAKGLSIPFISATGL